jgi:hypothetical protein
LKARVHAVEEGHPKLASTWLLPTCGLAIVTIGVWALWPLGRTSIDSPDLTVATQAAPPAPVELDIDAFRAPLWIVAAPPPEPPAPPPPPPPLRLQLLAIVDERGVYKAAIYDPDADRLFVASTGETIAGRTVETIGHDSVDLREGDQTRRLALNPQEGRP